MQHVKLDEYEIGPVRSRKEDAVQHVMQNEYESGPVG